MLFLWGVFCAWAAVPVPLHPLQACDDRRFPVVEEDWILGCSHTGKVDSLWSFQTTTVERLPRDESWLHGIDPFRVGADGGFWNIQEKRFVSARIFTSPSESAGRVSDRYVLVVSSDKAIVLDRIQGISYQTDARPIGYQLPVIVQEQMAWIEWSDAAQQIVLWNWREERKRLLSANEPLYLAVDGEALIWSEPNQIVVLNTTTGERRSVDTRAKGAISSKDGRVCWAEWRNDLDIVCSDGFVLDREGDQFSPVQLNRGLIFQEEQGVMWLKY